MTKELSKYPSEYFDLPKSVRETIEIEWEKDPENLPSDIYSQWETLKELSREEIIGHLTEQSIHAEDSEPMDVLKDALLDSICNGDVQL
jgi:hypothetical protein